MIPLITIIIATFNAEKTLRGALDSVINQSFGDWECMIVDGASKDGTLDIIKEYADKDARIRWKSEPDTGIYNAMNKGWKMAKGTWIHYLGADDELLKDGIAMLLAADKDNCADVIYGNVMYRKANGEIVIHPHHSHKQLPWKTFACHQGLIMRKSVIQRLGGFDESLKIISDKDLVIRSYFLKPKCTYLPTDVNVAIFAEGGASSNLYKNYKESLYIYKKVRPGFKYLLYVLLHYPRMWFKKRLHRL